jgi:hypothetical protein
MLMFYVCRISEPDVPLLPLSACMALRDQIGAFWRLTIVEFPCSRPMAADCVRILFHFDNLGRNRLSTVTETVSSPYPLRSASETTPPSDASPSELGFANDRFSRSYRSESRSDDEHFVEAGAGLLCLPLAAIGLAAAADRFD